MVGNTHAVTHVLDVHSRRKQLAAAAYVLVDKELEVVPGKPPEANAEHLELLISNSFERRSRVVNASVIGPDSDEIIAKDLAKLEVVSKALPDLRRMANGNISYKQAQHYEDGCCVDAQGNHDRSISVSNFWAALHAVGLFGGSCFIERVAKSRWLSTSAVLTVIMAGFGIHMLLPRA